MYPTNTDQNPEQITPEDYLVCPSCKNLSRLTKSKTIDSRSGLALGLDMVCLHCGASNFIKPLNLIPWFATKNQMIQSITDSVQEV